LKKNKEKYLADPTQFRESLLQTLKFEKKDAEGCPQIAVITVSDLFIDETPKFEPESTNGASKKTEDNSAKEGEDADTDETPKKENFTGLAKQRLAYLIEHYDDPEKFGHILFSFEFPAHVRQELRTLHPQLEYIATCKLIGGIGDQVHLVRSRTNSKEMVEKLKVLGKHPSFIMTSPPSPIEEGTDGDLVKVQKEET